MTDMCSFLSIVTSSALRRFVSLLCDQTCTFILTFFPLKYYFLDRCSSVSVLKSRLSSLKDEVGVDNLAFKDFYRFVFKFGLEGTASVCSLAVLVLEKCISLRLCLLHRSKRFQRLTPYNCALNHLHTCLNRMLSLNDAWLVFC